MVNTTATSRELHSKVLGVGRRASAAFWSISHIFFFLGCLAVVVASMMGGRPEGDVEILEREVVASTTPMDEGMRKRHKYSDFFRLW